MKLNQDTYINDNQIVMIYVDETNNIVKIKMSTGEIFEYGKFNNIDSACNTAENLHTEMINTITETHKDTSK